MTLTEALALLDPDSDAHWTDDGLPLLSALVKITGVDGITREHVVEKAPQFNRERARELRNAEPKEAPEPSLNELLGTASEDSAMAMPMREVMASPELLERVIREIETQAIDLRRQKEALEYRLRELYAKSQLAVRQLTRLQRGRKGAESDGLQRYLASQREARAARAARARAFIEAGTTAKDVAAELRTQSPIDAAMSARKAPRGSARPAVPPMQPQGG